MSTPTSPLCRDGAACPQPSLQSTFWGGAGGLPGLSGEPGGPTPAVLGRGGAGGGHTFTAPSGVAPEDAVLLLDEVPAQDYVLPLLCAFPAHSVCVVRSSAPAKPRAPRRHPLACLVPLQPPGCPALMGNAWRAQAGVQGTAPKAAWPGGATLPRGAHSTPASRCPGSATPQWGSPVLPSPRRPPPGDPILDVVEKALGHERVLIEVDEMRRLRR